MSEHVAGVEELGAGLYSTQQQLTFIFDPASTEKTVANPDTKL